jgi:glycosyltransferase involved in cell wall biosynthesis
VDLHASRVLFALPGLVRYLRQEKPRAMLSAMEHANVVALMARQFAGGQTRLVITEHNTLTNLTANDPSLRARWLPYVMRWVYPFASTIVAVSAGVADDLAKVLSLPRDRIKVIYNPIDSVRIFSLASAGFEHPWFSPDSPPVILGVGRLSMQKDFKTLIQAFAILRNKRKARLIILGEGEERETLENMIATLDLTSDIALPGFVGNPMAYMRNAAVFVLSSLFEGLPTVLLEAMCCDTPVVSTDCPNGPAEILENGKWGRMASVGDIDGLAQAMIKTLDEPKHPNVLQRAKYFSVENAVTQYLEVLGFA